MVAAKRIDAKIMKAKLVLIKYVISKEKVKRNIFLLTSQFSKVLTSELMSQLLIDKWWFPLRMH